MYLMADSRLGREWNLTLNMLRETKRAVDDRPVWGVAALRSLDPAAPDVQALDTMLSDLGQHVDTVFVWLDDCAEHRLRAGAVAGLAELAAHHRDLAVHSLYGGYLSLLLHRFGWCGTASGIGYSESRRAAELAESGGGNTPPRYYLPLVHMFTKPKVAEAFIRRAGPIAECRCTVCRSVVDGVAVGGLNEEQLARHFVHARDAERQRVIAADLPALIEELRAAHQVAADVGLDVAHDHLKTWAAGLENADP
jgi:hypothetical protein